MAKSKQVRRVADILRPLTSNKKIVTYLITKCVEGTSNKVYIYVVAKPLKGSILALVRFWGRFSAEGLKHTSDTFDQATFQKLLDEKAKKGYKLVSDEELLKFEQEYTDICAHISEKL